MGITPLSDNLDIIAALPDAPNDAGLTSAELKAKFDEAGNLVKTYVNESLIPQLDGENLPLVFGTEGGQTIKQAIEEATVGTLPDGSITAAKLETALADKIGGALTSEDAYLKEQSASTATKTIFNLDESATPDEVLQAIGAKLPVIDKNMLNILHLKLLQSSPQSDIDAWGDPLADTSMISTSLSTFKLDTGTASVFKLIQNSVNSSDNVFGTISYGVAVGQTFTVPGFVSNSKLTIQCRLRKFNTPTDNIVCSIYATSGGLPTGSALYSTTISGASLTTSFTNYNFVFNNVSLTNGTVYCFTLSRSGATSDTNQYSAGFAASNVYSGGTGLQNFGSWSTKTEDMYFQMFTENATIIWSVVTPKEALSYAAVCADQAENAGSITWYLSDDGTNWTEIAALDTMQNVAFDAVYLRLKCVITGDATVNAVAWGGY